MTISYFLLDSKLIEQATPNFALSEGTGGLFCP
jgi:hypothetical protein